MEDSIMKKLFYFALAALTLAACAKAMTPEKENETNVRKVKVSFKAVLDQEDMTKAEINLSNGETSWAKDDEIAVHTKNGKLAILKAASDGSTAVFSGEIEDGDEIEDGAIAYYPATIAKEGDATKVTLPASYSSAAVAAKGILLRGVLSKTDDEFDFKHIGALLKVTVTNIPTDVTAIEFKSETKMITGDLDVDISAPTAPKCVMGSGSGSTITVSTVAADRTSPSTVFCIPLPTGELTGGFYITLKEGSTAVAAKATKNAVVIERAKLFKMKEFAAESASLDKWYIAGLFNNWNTTANQMEEVTGHSDWLVAKNITLPNEDTNKGFKFFNNGTWVGGDCSALHKEFGGDTNTSAQNIDFTHGASYDIYYNPTTNKFFLANAGEAWERTIYMMSDMALSDNTYKLHVWAHDGSGALTTWPGVVGTTETISGIKYYKFQLDINNSPAGAYDCIFSTGEDSNPSRRYDFRDGKLVINDNDAAFYLSFAGNKYNTAVENSTYGDAATNPMTQFSDPAKPQGSSRWDVYQGSTLLQYMEWNDSPVLVTKNIQVGPTTTDLFFRYGYDDNYYVPVTAGAVSPNTEFDVTYATGSRSSQPKFSVPSLDGTYLCDFYLDIINNKAKVVPIAKTDANATVYVRLIDRTVDHAYLYAWDSSWTNADFPGQEMTEETIDGIKYYKIDLPVMKLWDKSVKLIVSDGSHSGHWQTNDFTSADWSGRKDAYYFSVAGNFISQSTASDIGFTIASQFPGVNWSTGSWLTSDRADYIAAWKATSDADNLYMYFLLSKNQITATSYIYSGYDTDNGTGGTDAGGNVNGKYNARSLIYPFKLEGDEIVCRNNSGWDDYIECPVGERPVSGTPVSYGVIKSDFAHLEVKIPRSAIGATASNLTIGVNHSWQWAVSGQRSITLAATE